MSDDLRHAPDALVSVGSDRTIVGMNAAAERLLGFPEREAIGAPWAEILRLRDGSGHLVGEFNDPFETAPPMATGSPEREQLLHRRDGSERWVAVRARYLWVEGKLDRVIVSMRDISRRRIVERSAYDLIATLAHDLRSPLTSVKGFTSTILRNWERLPDEQKQHMLQTIDFDADRMNRLLGDLLDFSRLEAGRFELRRVEVDIASLVTRVVDRVAMDAKSHKLTSEFPRDFPSVMADLGKVEQVVVNLVENAVKHGDPGAITVTGAVDEGRDFSRVIIRVRDSGPGIEPAHVPYVFTKFYRKGTGNRHSGTGLGLYICKGVIEAHGGDIAIEETSPSGTVFAFSLPIER